MPVTGDAAKNGDRAAMNDPLRSRRPLIVGLLLVLAVLALYGRTATFGFINYDDNIYLYDNREVSDGLTAQGIAWAFRDTGTGNWHPLTWLSHQLDVELFGLRPGAHHLMNVLIHAGNTVLLFLLLRGLTGSLWPGAFTAALFALHPLHIQSVAWVSERKDVLSTLLGLATVLLYLRWLRRPRPGGYLLVCAAFALSLMAKPMLVTLPFVLLLLDWWPLGRLSASPGGLPRGERQARLVLEKIPLLALAGVFAFIAYLAQKQSNAVLVRFSLPERAANAVTSYAAYLGKMFLPRRLAIFYPLPNTPPPIWRALPAALLLLVITVLALRLRRSRPWLSTGWLWYLVMLLPVIGLVQVGDQSMADRYTYLPLTGCFLMIAWECARPPGRLDRRGYLRAALAILVLVALAACTTVELGHWRGTIPLMEHALQVTGDNYAADNNLGSALLEEGKLPESISHFEAALKVRPAHPNAHYNLGVALIKLGRFQEAERHFRMALHTQPGDVDTRVNLGAVLINLERYEEAVQQLREVLRIKPDHAGARQNLDLALARLRQKSSEPAAAPPVPEAPSFHGGTARDRAQTQYSTALVLLRQGDREGAIRHLEAALQFWPEYPEARAMLAEARARIRK